MIATWFGDESAPLFGVWHLPDGGRARSVAVLCAPLGREQGITHRAFRILSERLAARGVAALQFDHLATGDSAGDSNTPALVDAWLGGIEMAVAAARSAGAEHVTVIGLRIGAVLGGLVAQRGGVDAFVAWDPCASGSAFLREERTLRRLSLGDVPTAVPEGALEASGSTYSAQTVTDLSPLRLPEALAIPTLLALRDDRPVPKAVAPLAASVGVAQIVAVAHDTFLDVVDIGSTPPVQTIEEIVAWVDNQAPVRLGALDVRARHSAVVATVDGRDVVETIVSLGPNRLFGITSMIGGTEPATCVLFTPTATNYHPNVARLAVEVGRRIAAAGYASVRYDAYDLGDSPDGGQVDGPRYYTPETTRDAADAARACTQLLDGDLVVVGLCSGAWTAAMLIPELAPKAAYLLNPLVWTKSRPAMSPSLPTEPSFVARTFNRAQRLPGLATAGQLLWRALATLRLVATPTAMLDTARHRDTKTTVLLSPWEASVLDRRLGFGERRRLEGRGNLRFVPTAHDDHALLTATLRNEVSDQLMGWLAADITPVPADAVRA